MDGPLIEMFLPYFLFWQNGYVSVTSRFVVLISLLPPRDPDNLELSLLPPLFFFNYYCELRNERSCLHAADVMKHRELVSSLAKQEKGPHPLWH